MSIRKMTTCAVTVALTAVCSWIQIPAAVPFTMQTFAVYCTLLLLGGRWGTVSVCVYLLAGAVGLPVFSGFGGGIGKLLGPTGGYLWGFLPLCLLYWSAEKKCPPALSLAVGTLLCYACGTAWFSHVYNVTFAAALLKCVVPFLLADGAKLGAALFISPRIVRAIN